MCHVVAQRPRYLVQGVPIQCALYLSRVGPSLGRECVLAVVEEPASSCTHPGAQMWTVAPEVCGLFVRRTVLTIIDPVWAYRGAVHKGGCARVPSPGSQPPILGLEIIDDL